MHPLLVISVPHDIDPKLSLNMYQLYRTVGDSSGCGGFNVDHDRRHVDNQTSIIFSEQPNASNESSQRIPACLPIYQLFDVRFHGVEPDRRWPRSGKKTPIKKSPKPTTAEIFPASPSIPSQKVSILNPATTSRPTRPPNERISFDAIGRPTH